MSGSGSIDKGEFALMMKVMGVEMDDDLISTVMKQAKVGFAAWLKIEDEKNIEKCQTIWDEFDADKSGTMDLKEINAVISRLQQLGCSAERMTAAGLNRFSTPGQLNFEEFSAWFLKQEGLPDDLGPPAAAGAAGLKSGKKKPLAMVGRGARLLFTPVRMVGGGAGALLKRSRDLLGGSAEDDARELMVSTTACKRLFSLGAFLTPMALCSRMIRTR